MKPAFIVGIVVSCASLLPLGIWSEVERSFRALITYYAVICVLLFFLIGFSTYHGIRLLTTIAATSNAVGTKRAYKQFVGRVKPIFLTTYAQGNAFVAHYKWNVGRSCNCFYYLRFRWRFSICIYWIECCWKVT